MPAARARRDRREDGVVVVGVANASLSVERGEISVLMGLCGIGEVDAAARGQRPEPRARAVRWLVGDGDAIVDIGVKCDPAHAAQDPGRCASPWCFSSFGLLPWRTVRDNVGLGLELRR